MTFLKQTFTEEEKKKATAALMRSAGFTSDYKVLLIGSIIIATGAIFSDSIAVLIASMIIAPLAMPIITLGLGIVARRRALIVRSVSVLILSCLITFGVAILLTMLFGEVSVKDVYISFSGNRIIAFLVALAAGYIGAYGVLSPKVAEAIAGIAIAVSLMPPLAATSISIVSGDESRAFEAGSLFLLNVIGIVMASILVFWLHGVGRRHVPVAIDSSLAG